MKLYVKSIFWQKVYQKYVPLFGLFLMASLSACTTLSSTSGSVQNQYPSPEDSGLLVSQPFPAQEDVCISLDSNAATEPFDVPDHFIIACPQHEVGAINDRKREQSAEILGLQGSWTLLRVNNSFRTDEG